MRIIPVIVSSLILFCNSCKTSEERKTSVSYSNIQEYVKDAKINDKNILFFYSGKPRFPMPNVYCFNRDGLQLNSPPNCFQYITDYVRLLNDSIIPTKAGGETIKHFLDSTALLNVYDEVISDGSFTGYDYYLFVDYIAIPIASMKETLYMAKNEVEKSRKKIKLFLVHGISENNKAIYKSESQAKKDSSKTD